MLGGVIMVIMV